MEYTKDIIFNVKYGDKVEKIKLRNNSLRQKAKKIYQNNQFIIITLLLLTILVGIDLYMVSNFINILVTLY